MAKISIIIPVYNVEKYLRRCLDSVLAQTFADWDAICINDGSTDGCKKILAEYAARDKRFVVINKKNAGVSAARNDGLARATGEYVMFLDSDDTICPQTMRITYELARENDADIVSFRYDTRPICARYNLRRVRYKRTDNIFKYATERNHARGMWRIHHCYPVMHLYRRKLIQDISFPTDIAISEDFPWWSRVMLRRPVTVITRLKLYYYAQNATSALNSASALRVFDGISRGILDAYQYYRANASGGDMKIWSREFMWPFIFSAVRASRNVDAAHFDLVRARLMQMHEIGVFDNAPTMRARKYRRRIMKILA